MRIHLGSNEVLTGKYKKNVVTNPLNNACTLRDADPGILVPGKRRSL